MENLPVLAGSFSSLIFVLGNVSMLVKAWRTRDVQSYSLAQVGLNNIGNIVHWLYVSSLPFGPIWFLHAFFTLSTGIMLIWCLMYRYRPALMEKQTTETLKRVKRNARRITQTLEFPKLQLSEGEKLSSKDIS